MVPAELGGNQQDGTGGFFGERRHKHVRAHYEFHTETVPGSSPGKLGKKHRARIADVDDALSLWVRAIDMGGWRHPLEGCGQKAHLSILSEVPTTPLACHRQASEPASGRGLIHTFRPVSASRKRRVFLASPLMFAASPRARDSTTSEQFRFLVGVGASEAAKLVPSHHNKPGRCGCRWALNHAAA